MNLLEDVKARRWDDVRSTLKNNWIGILVGGLILLCLIAIAVAIPMAIKGDAVYAQQCEDAGGHVVTRTTFGTGVSSNGKPATTYSTLKFCLTDDGRMIEVDS